MRFGIPTETGLGKGMVERRVALSSAGVRELCQAGAEVIVQQGAGHGAGFPDEEYEAAGAHIVYTAAEAYGRADVVLRVERPRDEEWRLLPEGVDADKIKANYKNGVLEITMPAPKQIASKKIQIEAQK